MTSISNYESVVLPIENEENEKKKNVFGFLNKFKNSKHKFSLNKKHIAVASMMLMLSGAVYVNYLYAAGDINNFTETGKNYGDSILVEGNASEEISETAAYFSEARIAKQQSRDEAVATLKNLYGSAENGSEEVSVLAEKADSIAANMELENKIETMIKGKGFSDCIVYISGDYADVMVSTDGLLPTEAALIKDAIVQETSVPVENISIVEVNK